MRASRDADDHDVSIFKKRTPSEITADTIIDSLLNSSNSIKASTDWVTKFHGLQITCNSTSAS